MPHFWTYAGRTLYSLFLSFLLLIFFADLDANFSVLLDESANCTHKLGKGISKHKPYYSIIIGVVVSFFVVLALAFIFVRYR
jgi:hypothetical protein